MQDSLMASVKASEKAHCTSTHQHPPFREQLQMMHLLIINLPGPRRQQPQCLGYHSLYTAVAASTVTLVASVEALPNLIDFIFAYSFCSNLLRRMNANHISSKLDVTSVTSPLFMALVATFVTSPLPLPKAATVLPYP